VHVVGIVNNEQENFNPEDPTGKDFFDTHVNAQAFIDNVISLWDVKGVKAGHYVLYDSVASDDDVVISMVIENVYELYADVDFAVTGAIIPAPPQSQIGDEWEIWERRHIFRWTGVGHEEGDSWHDVTVTACSDPSLVGSEFDFGY
jgi:hypothetical protein